MSLAESLVSCPWQPLILGDYLVDGDSMASGTRSSVSGVLLKPVVLWLEVLLGGCIIWSHLLLNGFLSMWHLLTLLRAVIWLEFLNGVVKILLETSEKLFVMRAIPLHVTVQVQLFTPLLVVASWIKILLVVPHLVHFAVGEGWPAEGVPESLGALITRLRHWK